MKKNRKIRNAFVKYSAVGIGAVGGVGSVAALEATNTHLVEDNTTASVLTNVSIGFGSGVVEGFAAYGATRRFTTKKDEKAQEKVFVANAAMATGQVPVESAKNIQKTQEEINKEFNKKAFARRQYEKAQKLDK